jgi:hypothetical protein
VGKSRFPLRKRSGKGKFENVYTYLPMTTSSDAQDRSLAGHLDSAADEEGEPLAELWDLVHIHTAKEILETNAVKCMGDKCRLVACSIWSSTLNPEEQWFTCLGKLLCTITCFILLLHTIQDDISSTLHPPHSHTHSSSPLDCQRDDFDGWGDKLPVKGHLDDEWRNTVRDKCTNDDDPVMPNVPRVPGGEPTTACPSMSSPEENLPLVLTKQIVRDAVAECGLVLPPIPSVGKTGYAGVNRRVKRSRVGYRADIYMGNEKYFSLIYDTALEAALWYAKAAYLRDTRWFVKVTKPVLEMDTLIPIPSNPLAFRIDSTLSRVMKHGYVRVEKGGNQDLTLKQLRDSDVVMGRNASKEHTGTKIFREKLEKMQTDYTSGGGEGRLCHKVVMKYVNDLMNGPKKIRFMERYLDNNNNNNILYGAVGTMAEVSDYSSHLIGNIVQSLKPKKGKGKTTKKTGTKKTGVDDDDVSDEDSKKRKATKKTGTKKTGMDDDDSDGDCESKPKAKKQKKMKKQWRK